MKIPEYKCTRRTSFMKLFHAFFFRLRRGDVLGGVDGVEELATAESVALTCCAGGSAVVGMVCGCLFRCSARAVHVAGFRNNRDAHRRPVRQVSGDKDSNAGSRDTVRKDQ